MKNFKILFLAIFVFTVNGCTDDFEETNENPNLITEISPGTLLNEIIYGLVSNALSNNTHVNNQLAQVQLPYPSVYGGVHRYEIFPSTGVSTWNASYRWANNLKEMLNASEEVNDPNYKAVALTLNAWLYSNLTDCFGDIPMSEASLADQGIFQPVYDRQEDIYLTLLADLEAANSLYEHGNSMIYGDEILFHNDTEKWQKFTNSLHLRLLLRISGVYPAAIQKIRTILSNPSQYPIINTSAESAIFEVTGIIPNISPWPRPGDYYNTHIVSSFFIDNLLALEDPRLPYFAYQATAQGSPVGYIGVPSGYDPDLNIDYNPSRANDNQIIAPFHIPIITYSEIEFIKAELIQKGLIAGNAEEHYKNGVKSAVSFWTQQEIGDEYFLNENARYNGTLERIMLQKYLVLYFTDYQQWSEIRRTGYPQLPATNSMLNNGILPTRLLYPPDQVTYNLDNYNQAVSQMGGDNISTRVWWDVD